MTKPQQKREKGQKREKKKRDWTTAEDALLKRLKTEHSELTWGEIIEKGNLDRDEKSCSHRWINYLMCEFNKGEFSQEEDELIIVLNSLRVR